jgi:hypothetical protein
MDSLEATLRYGITRSEVPDVEQLRDLFFASLLGAIIDNRETGAVSRALHDAYVEALIEQHDFDANYDPDLLPWREAEGLFTKAALAAYRAGYPEHSDEPWEGEYWEELLPTEGLWERRIVRDAGHLLGHYAAARAKVIDKHLRQTTVDRAAAPGGDRREVGSQA